MAELNCQICLNAYDTVEHLPRLLLCGHTICTKCLTTILVTSKACPNCRKETSSDDIDDFQTNFALVEIMGSVSNLLSSRENFVQKYREKLVNRQCELEEQMTRLKSMKDNIDLNISNAKGIEEQLKSLMENCDPFDRKSIDKLLDIDQSLDAISSHIEHENPHLVRDICLKSESFSSTNKFLTQIHKNLIESRRVVALLRVDGIKKFAKLSIRDDLLFIHSFEKYEKTDNDVSICFIDLMNQVLRTGRAKNVYAFLDLTFDEDSFPKRALISITKSTSHVGLQFLKLCTGEFGRSYKGLSYDQKYEVTKSNVEIERIVQLKNFGWDRKEVDDYSTYLLAQGELDMDITPIKCGTCYLFLCQDGSFEIFMYSIPTSSAVPHKKVSQSSRGNFAGTVVDTNNDFSTTFKAANHRKIVDCGIAVRW